MPGISMSSSATHVGGLRGGQDLVAPAHLGDDREVVLEVQQRRQRAAHHGLVLGEQEADDVGGVGWGGHGVNLPVAEGMAGGLGLQVLPASRTVTAPHRVSPRDRPHRRRGHSRKSPSFPPTDSGRRSRPGARAARSGRGCRRRRWLPTVAAKPRPSSGTSRDTSPPRAQRDSGASAREWRITLVTASRRLQASTASASARRTRRSPRPPGVGVELMPAASSAACAEAISTASVAPPVAADRLPDVVQRLPRHLLDLLDLVQRRVQARRRAVGGGVAGLGQQRCASSDFSVIMDSEWPVRSCRSRASRSRSSFVASCATGRAGLAQLADQDRHLRMPVVASRRRTRQGQQRPAVEVEPETTRTASSGRPPHDARTPAASPAPRPSPAPVAT